MRCCLILSRLLLACLLFDALPVLAQTSNTAPAVEILKPRHRQGFAESEEIAFEGRAYDLEDGDVPADKLVWRSDLSGEIGRGAAFRARLAKGRHLVSLLATDSSGQTGITNVLIIVGTVAPATKPDQSAVAPTTQPALKETVAASQPARKEVPPATQPVPKEVGPASKPSEETAAASTDPPRPTLGPSVETQPAATLAGLPAAPGDTPLIAAIKADQEDIALSFIKSGELVNVPGYNGDTPLHHAVNRLSHKLTAALVNGGANVNAQNLQGYTPLHSAVIKSDFDNATLLLLAGAKTELKTKYEGCTPLHDAAAIANAGMIELLVHWHASLDALTERGYTPLYLAVERTSSGLGSAKLLVSKANVNKADGRGLTPLHLAAGNGNLELIEYLLGQKADLNSRSVVFGSALQYAVRYQQEDAVKALLRHKAELSITDGEGRTALHLAAALPSLSLAHALVEGGCPVGMLDKNGKQAADLAPDDQQGEFVKLYLKTLKKGD